MKKVIAILAITALVLTGLILYTIQTQKQVVGTSTQVVERIEPPTRAELLRLTNIERQIAGVPILNPDSVLDKTAQERSDDMLARNYFGHFDPITGEGMIDKQDAGCKQSENQTQNIYVNDSDHAIKAFMSSEAHRNALLNPKYTRVGFGITNDIIVQHFCE
jgi:uncharacterized protein YkwD